MRVLTRHTAATTVRAERIGAIQSVELTEAEMTASKMFHRLLDENYTVIEAAERALLAMPEAERSAGFAEWLSHDTLSFDGDGILVRA